MVYEFLSISDMTGSLLWSSIEWSTIHVGIGRKKLSLDYDIYGNLPPRSCIKHIWNFTKEYGISLPTSPTHLELNIEGDLLHMEKFPHSELTPKQLNKLNQCQLYLQIHTFSDISNGHGTFFEKIYYDGHQDEFHQATYSWPAQGCKGPKE